MGQQQQRNGNGTGADLDSTASTSAVSETVLSGLADAMVGIVAIDAGHGITFINTLFLQTVGMDGLQVDTLKERSFIDLFPETALPDPQATSTATRIADPKGTYHDITWTQNASGGWIGVLPLSDVRKPDHTGPFSKDELTGLGNRTYLKRRFETLIEAERTTPDGPVALYLDLDYFKQVNDTFSHAVGDGLLRKAAERLCKTLRKEDIIARVGGDEFVIILTGRDDAAVEQVTHRIIKLIARPFLVQGHHLTIGVSIGVSRLQQDDTGIDTLLQRADIALYDGKRQGRGRFQWFEEQMSQALKERREIENDLKKALLLDQFEVVFQPQMSLEDTGISGFEALLRWHHPTRGLVPPVDFIQIAEKTGIIIDLGAWVLEEACTIARDWPEQMSVAVNVSSVQFEHDSFPDTVLAALDRSGLDARRLELEITETALLNDEELVIRRMNDLRALGIGMSLDDFGIGYSSLNYLRKYPFDKVKIDQSFVREPFADEQASHIVGAVAQLGIAFGMNVLAEGVETDEQLSRIREHGCSSIQGYILSRPLNAQAVQDYLALPSGVTASTGTSHQPGEIKNDET